MAIGLVGKDLFGSSVRAGLSVTIVVLGCFASYAAMSFLGLGDARGELLPILIGPVVVMAVGFVGFLTNLICRVPFREWAAADARVKDLEKQLRPSLSVRTSTNHRAAPVQYGTTVVTLGGTRQTNILHDEDHSLRFDIINESATSAIGCEAYLVQFQSLNDDEEKAPWFPVRLPWLPSGKDDDRGVDIPPHGVRAIVLFRVVNNRVHLLRDEWVPVHMVHAINDYGEYCGLVTITSQNAATARIAFTLSCQGPGAQPLLNVMRRSPFDDDDSLTFAPTVGF